MIEPVSTALVGLQHAGQNMARIAERVASARGDVGGDADLSGSAVAANITAVNYAANAKVIEMVAERDDHLMDILA